MTRHIPNSLTVFRIVLIPVLVVLYYWGMPNRELLVTGVFVVAAVTDWLDGFLARTMGTTSKLGAFLDPVADKLIVSTALVLLVSDLSVLAKVIHPMLFALFSASCFEKRFPTNLVGFFNEGCLGSTTTCVTNVTTSLSIFSWFNIFWKVCCII